MIRPLLILTLLGAAGYGGYWAWYNVPEVRTRCQDILQMDKVQTLEIRHSAANIMETHKRELLVDSDHVFSDPILQYYPYVLMEVKYNRGQDRTGEGIILWSLVDGEMVINTSTWEKTHGFLDCLSYGADRNDFKIINALTMRGGMLDRDGLTRILNVENEKLDTWIDSCRKKNLIVQSGNYYRLHLQDPKLQVLPETKLDHWLVTKTSKNAQRVPKKYRPAQIEQIARSAFGSDFAIRKMKEVFLPVYSIIVQNPDGSQMTTYWNALNGKRLDHPYLIE